MRADSGGSLRGLRLAAELTQAELARQAGVSRALVSAVEAGRHLPRVDAALALARALGTTSEALFGAQPRATMDALTGEPPAAGTPVRVGLVGNRLVTVPARLADEGWDVIDGFAGEIDSAQLDRIGRGAPSLVVAGCEPGLLLLERILREHGTRALAIATSNGPSLAALAAGRLHAAAIHFPTGAAPPSDDSGVVRVHLASWRVGLVAPADTRGAWWREALSGRREVIQREAGAAAQQAFERAARHRDRTIAGPRVASHLAAGRRSIATGMPAVTIEPAAAAVGGVFHPLETHDVELWVHRQHASEVGVERLLDLTTAPIFRRTLERVGGYDLSGAGRRVA